MAFLAAQVSSPGGGRGGAEPQGAGGTESITTGSVLGVAIVRGALGRWHLNRALGTTTMDTRMGQRVPALRGQASSSCCDDAGPALAHLKAHELEVSELSQHRPGQVPHGSRTFSGSLLPSAQTQTPQPSTLAFPDLPCAPVSRRLLPSVPAPGHTQVSARPSCSLPSHVLFPFSGKILLIPESPPQPPGLLRAQFVVAPGGGGRPELSTQQSRTGGNSPVPVLHAAPGGPQRPPGSTLGHASHILPCQRRPACPGVQRHQPETSSINIWRANATRGDGSSSPPDPDLWIPSSGGPATVLFSC